MSHPPTTPIELSEREFQQVEQYANKRGLSLDEATSQIFRAAMVERFGACPKPPGQVIQFKREKP